MSLVRRALGVWGTALGLNGPWEILHGTLYQGFAFDLAHMAWCLQASVVDALYTTVLYGVIAGIKRNSGWMAAPSRGDLGVIVLSGLAVALLIEYWALGTERWAYTSYMPVLPGLRVGLSPVVQLVILPLLTFWIMRRWERGR